MMAIAAAILYALFVWWFSTGLVLMLVLRRRAERAALVGAALLFPICLWVLSWAAVTPTVAGAYAAFSAAIVLWGTQEVAFLTGVVTGPRPRACPPEARGFDRFCYAISAILYHEVALIASGALVLAVTFGGANQVGAMTFLVLWVMRLSAKLNLFFGVPVLNDEMLPAPIDFIRSYFRRGPPNAFLPVSLIASAFFTWILAADAADAATPTAVRVGDVLVAALMGLAILEHLFMVVPLPIERMWRWSMNRRSRHESSRRDAGSLERVAAPTQP